MKKPNNDAETLVIPMDKDTMMEMVRKVVCDTLTKNAEPVRFRIDETERTLSFDVNAECSLQLMDLRYAMENVLEVLQECYGDVYGKADHKFVCDPWVDGNYADSLGINEYRTIITINF